MSLRWIAKVTVWMAKTTMHSSRMHTARSLTISRIICHACPPPHTPPAMHNPPPAMHIPPAMHTTPLPSMPPCHTHPLPCMPLPCTPSLAMHTPPGHACPLVTHAPSPMDRMTDICKNITFANFVCGR